MIKIVSGWHHNVWQFGALRYVGVNDDLLVEVDFVCEQVNQRA